MLRQQFSIQQHCAFVFNFVVNEQRVAMIPRVWQLCVCVRGVCVCSTLIIDHKNCLLACVIIDKQVVLILGLPSSSSASSSSSTSSRRRQPTISTQPERDPHNYKTISPHAAPEACLTLPDPGTLLFSLSLSLCTAY